MRCEFCRDPGRIPEAVSICRDCAPRFAAIEDVAEKAMAWFKTADVVTARHAEILLRLALAALAKIKDG